MNTECLRGSVHVCVCVCVCLCGAVVPHGIVKLSRLKQDLGRQSPIIVPKTGNSFYIEKVSFVIFYWRMMFRLRKFQIMRIKTRFTSR